MIGHIGKIKRIDIWAPQLGERGYGKLVKDAVVPEDLDYDRWIGPAPMAPYTPDRVKSGGSWHIYDYALGFIAGWGAHPLDIMQWGMDADGTSPIRYKGTGKIPEKGLANTITTWDVEAEYPCGVPVRFMSSSTAKPVVTKYNPRFRENGTTFFGEDGWVSISRGACYMNKGDKMVNTSTIKFTDKEKEKVYHSANHARNFVDCIKSRKPTINPFESAIRSDTISHLSNIAIRTKREIKWDPKTETITGDAEAAKMLNRPMRAPYVM